MKVRTKYNKEVSSGGLGETRDFKIKASGEIFQMFSSTLYSNKPRAILRELGCNAYDSHVANGNQDKPFEVTLPTQWEPTLEIRDFGTGLSHEDMMELYSTYFESTKRDSNDYTGAFGIGSKSPFSYTDQFTVVSIFGGEKRTYIASLSDEGTPTLSSVGCVASSEPTGLAVRMAIGPNDMATFQGEALDVYSYFRTIPILKGAKEAVIKPEYTSQEKGLWGLRSAREVNRYRSNPQGSGFRIVQGNIWFPVDTKAITNSKFKLDNIGYDFRIDLFFEIGDLQVALNRESLHYDTKTQKLIDQRVGSFLKDYVKELEYKAKDVKSILEALEFTKDHSEEVKKLQSFIPGFTIANPFFKYVGPKNGYRSTIQIPYLESAQFEKIHATGLNLAHLADHKSPTYKRLGSIAASMHKPYNAPVSSGKGFTWDLSTRSNSFQLPSTSRELPYIVLKDVSGEGPKVGALKYYLEQQGYIKNATVYGYSCNGEITTKRDFYIFEHDDEAEVNKFLKFIDPRLKVDVKLSTLPHPPKSYSTTSGVKRKLTEYYQYEGFVAPRTSWGNNYANRSMKWTTLEVPDTSVPRIFVPMSSWQPMYGTEQYSKDAFDSLVSRAMELGIVKVREDVVGIPATYKDNIKDLEKEGWKNLFDLTYDTISGILVKYGQDDISIANVETLPLPPVPLYVLKYHGPSHFSDPNVRELVELQKKQIGVKAALPRGIAQSLDDRFHFSTKLGLDLYKVSTKFQTELEAKATSVSGKFPLAHLVPEKHVQELVWYLNNR